MKNGLSRLMLRFGSGIRPSANPWRDFPFGRQPRADANTYRRLHSEACKVRYPEIDALERNAGFAIDLSWMQELALHTQTVIKESALNFSHGRVLYSALRRRFIDWQPLPGNAVLVVETGTARGFSALCMARALADAGLAGHVLTIDVLPHDVAMYWNCIDDIEGPKARRELLDSYKALLERIIFVEGDTREMLNRLGMGRVHAAYLDAQHTFQDVMNEFCSISARQRAGDIVIFDDVTPALFPGVVDAVAVIEHEYPYRVERIEASAQRGYAVATRVSD